MGMILKTRKLTNGTRKEVKWADDGGKKYEGMEVDANDELDEDEEMAQKVEEGKDGMVVFRRRVLA